ncbi:hypothetical protein [uncultured Pseudodesulfovibrio sp.]|uniref:hypothetical protein n=1 Tax=uncultured Pseudodesulfovibrio sp. TaxID=2035858 RepID=UPI0029C977B3|nr:hypothetical protein [uncultured Pseudodesulfovibrio sp.]
MRPTLALSIILVLLLCGCNAAKTIIPLDPEVTPVTTPTLYRYAPEKETLVLTVETKGQNDQERSFQAMTIEFESVEDNGQLFLTTRLVKIQQQGKTIAPALPIAEITGRSDMMGNGELISAHSPWKLSLPDGERQEKELLENLKFDPKDILWPLPEAPIVTGQLLTSFGNAHIKIGDSPKQQTPLKLLLEGEKVVDGVTYVTAQLDDQISTTVQGRTAKMLLKGYLKMDKATMMPVTAFVAMTYSLGNTPLGASKISIVKIP